MQSICLWLPTIRCAQHLPSTLSAVPVDRLCIFFVLFLRCDPDSCNTTCDEPHAFYLGCAYKFWSQDCESDAGFGRTKTAYCHYTIKALEPRRRIERR